MCLYLWKALIECDGRDIYDNMLRCLMNRVKEGFLNSVVKARITRRGRVIGCSFLVRLEAFSRLAICSLGPWPSSL